MIQTSSLAITKKNQFTLKVDNFKLYLPSCIELSPSNGIVYVGTVGNWSKHRTKRLVKMGAFDAKSFGLIGSARPGASNASANQDSVQQENNPSQKVCLWRQTVSARPRNHRQAADFRDLLGRTLDLQHEYRRPANPQANRTCSIWTCEWHCTARRTGLSRSIRKSAEVGLAVTRSVLKICRISQLYFGRPNWTTITRFAKKVDVDDIKYFPGLRLVIVGRLSDNRYDILDVKTNKYASKKVLGDRRHLLRNNLRAHFEPRNRLLLFSIKVHYSAFDNKAVNPFSFKQVRNYDFGNQVLLVKHLPKHRRHILYVSYKRIAVLDHLAGQFELVDLGSKLISGTVCIREKPCALANGTVLWFMSQRKQNVTEYHFQNKRLRRNGNYGLLGKKPGLV